MYVRSSKLFYWLGFAFLFIWSVVNVIYSYNLPWYYYNND